MSSRKIIVCVSPAPSGARIIRTAAQVAQARDSQLIALFVETPTHSTLSDESSRRLDANMALAARMGARTETVYGEDVPTRIAEYAHMSEADTVILGQSAVPVLKRLFQTSLSDRLSTLLPDKTLMIIPDVSARAQRNVKISQQAEHGVIKDMLKVAALLGAATVLALLFQKAGLQDANIITLYILCVTLTAVLTSSPLAGIVSAAASVVIFNYLFTEPLFYFQVYDPGYMITFVIMFIAAFITGTLASRLKEYARQSSKKAFRTQILLDASRLLGQEDSRGKILEVTGSQLLKLTGRTILIYPAESGTLKEPQILVPGYEEQALPDGQWQLPALSEKDHETASRALREGKSVGAWTDTCPEADYIFLPVRIHGHSYGVFAISRDKKEMSSFTHSICDSIVSECALAMENEYSERAREEAAASMKNEQLRTTLLRSISHDLRTPLTSIYGNADNLLADSDRIDEETKKEIYRDIREDSYWLISVVQNLLSVTRLENKELKRNKDIELIDDVIGEALQHSDRSVGNRRVIFEPGGENLFVEADAALIEQVIINLVNNAIKYTPDGSKIRIETSGTEQEVLVSVSDNGPGVAEEELSKLFELFYMGDRTGADSRRGLGLGLGVCQSIVEAHEGSIHAQNLEPHGLRIWFSLPKKEIILDGNGNL